MGCGASSSENCTYFEGSSLATGECTGKICKCSTDICQVITYTKVVAGSSFSSAKVFEIIRVFNQEMFCFDLSRH